MTDEPLQSSDSACGQELARLCFWLKTLAVAVFFMAAVLVCELGVVIAKEVDFHHGEALLVGSVAAGTTLVGFVLGWLAHAAVRRIGSSR